MQEAADGVVTLIVFGAIALFAWLGVAGYLRNRKANVVTVYDYEAGLKFVQGKLVETLPPGRYIKGGFLSAADDTIIERVDMREQTFAVAGQEILTQDNLPVRVTVVVRWRIGDAALQKRTAASPATRLYETVQVFLRKRVGVTTLDALLADREQVTAGAVGELEAEAAKAGLVLIAIDMRDLTLVGGAKQAYADLWRAQKEGLSALERARGELAALRTLANAARMLKGNPELMNLRLLQALNGQPGKAAPTVVLGGGGGLLPVSRDPAPDGGDAE
jgi:regulator of protease activity HflC (stomatin/prohibitin superfamily)